MYCITHKLKLLVPVIFMIIFSIGCATSPPISNEAMTRQTIELKKERQVYKANQQKRITKIGTKLLKQYPKPIAIDFTYKQSPIVNAYSTGDEIVINDGLLAYAKTDDQLASVIAHEIGHSVRHHMAKEGAIKGSIQMLGLAAGILTGTYTRDLSSSLAKAATKPYSRSVEKEADFIGTVLAYEAGYDPEALPKFMKKLAVRLGDTDTNKYGHSHPPTPKRVAMIKKTTKVLNNGKLVPRILWSIMLDDVRLKGLYLKSQLLSTLKLLDYDYEKYDLKQMGLTFKVEDGTEPIYYIKDGFVYQSGN